MANASEAPSSSDESELDLLNRGFRYAFALTHHREDAEDIAQEAWLNLSRRYGKIPSHSMLFTTIKNLFIDRYRRSKVVAFESSEPDDAVDSKVAMEPGTSTDVETLLGTLRENEREAVFLHYIEGRTAAEIGQLTAQPRNSVLSLLRRGLQKLRCSISPDLAREEPTATNST